jgi:hypothetical protein
MRIFPNGFEILGRPERRFPKEEQRFTEDPSGILLLPSFSTSVV